MALGTSRLPSAGSTRTNYGDQGGSWCQNTANLLTGSTAETTLATIEVPAGYFGPNGDLLIDVAYSNNNSVGNKTLAFKIGNSLSSLTTLLTHVHTTVTFGVTTITLTNRNNVASQYAIGLNTSLVPTLITDPTINTDASFYIVVTGTLATGTDTLTLEKITADISYRD